MKNFILTTLTNQNSEPKFTFQHAPYEVRKAECRRVLEKYENRVAIICEVDKQSKQNLFLDKSKYLVPENLTMGQFMYLIRKRLKLAPEQSIVLLTENNQIPASTQLVSVIYNKNKNVDGFLYLMISSETTFG